MLSLKKLPILFVLLVVLNVVVIAMFDLGTSRTVRLITVGVLFLFYIFHTKRKHKGVAFILLFLFLKDFGMLYYYEFIGNSVYFLLGTIAYIGVILESVYLKKSPLDMGVVLGFVLCLLIGITSVFLLYDSLSSAFLETLNVPLFFLYGIFSLLMVFAAINYNKVYNSSRSFIFICLTLCFCLSDFLSYIAFYLNLDFLFYPERISYILGISVLIFFDLNTVLKEKEENEMQYYRDNGLF
jgi:hypothetical protein